MTQINKTALITGAAGGIGAQAARRLAKDGFALVLNYNKNEHGAAALAAELEADGARVICCRADIASEVQVNTMFQNATDTLGGVSVLVNNAGIALQKLFTDTSAEEFEAIFNANLTGAANCCRAAVPYMVNHKYGKIINISSVWGVCGASCEVAYSASKAGLIGLTKALARELAPSNIQVNCIAPGVIDTSMNSNLTPDEIENLKQAIPMGRFGSPGEVASLISFLAGDDSSYITAQIIGIDGGFI